ncbi:MAG TPA: hypothetical protein VHU83_22300 [Bryobacteraceae bacterium]|jgi:DNA-binding NtrC family response regulator|nr:hypothetical protein [Bryobacteraceae bacterium]
MNPYRSPRTNFTQETALIVHFRRQEREAVENFLSDADYHVLSANSDDEAMELCRSYRGAIHLLVTDVEEAADASWELAETAARIRPGLIVLFLSKDTMMTADQRLAIKAPFSPQVLLQMTQALARKAQHRERCN